MAMVDLYTLLPEIEPYLNSCPEAVIKQWLRIAARDFCVDTEIWRESLASVASVADQGDYTLASTAGNEAFINRILEVKLDDQVLGQDRYVYGPSGVLTLDPAPVTTGLDIDVKVAYWPLTSCDSYPDWLMNRWSRGFVAGTLFKLKAMADKPWRDDSAGLYERQYIDWTGKAKMEITGGRLTGPIQIRPGRFC